MAPSVMSPEDKKHKARQKRDLTKGPIMGHLIRLGIPMTIGIVAVMSAAVVDTWYISRLGTVPLAAISFCVPVLFAMQSLSIGLGIGASSVVSRAAGEGNRDHLARLVTDALLLAVLVVATVSIVGTLSVDPLFRLLRADPELMPYIRSYMHIAFIGAAFIVGPMVAGNLLRALGDARLPGMTMVAGAVINLILDPFLIFGIGPFPRMELAGAALATVLSNVTAVVVMGWIMVYREKLILLHIPPWAELKQSWGEVMRVGLPAIGTNMINPIMMALVTAVFASFGHAAVAGLGVAGRIEFLFAIPLLALSASIGPITGQNGGAGLSTRVREAFKSAYLIAIIWGTFTGLTLLLLSGVVAKLFSHDPDVIAVSRLFLSMVPLTAAGYGIVIATAAGFNALGRPFPGLVMSFGRSILLSSVGAWVGGHYFGLTGAIVAMALSNLISGLAVWLWVRGASMEVKQRRQKAELA
jgi:MATE family, multidrug efflux pump